MRLDGAERLYRRLLELQADDPNAQPFLGMLLYQRGRGPERDEAIRLRPRPRSSARWPCGPTSATPTPTTPRCWRSAGACPNGVRYEQDLSDERQGDQAGGYLVAFDAKSGERLWRLKVYDVPDDRAAGVSSGGLYFRSMRPAPGGAGLEIVNEAGAIFAVDLAKRSVAQVGGPPAVAPDPPAASPKPVPPKPKPPP